VDAGSIPATSTTVLTPTLFGYSTRHRLNRYGDRHLNQALHTVVRIRIQYQAATPRPATTSPAAPPKANQPRDQTLPGPLRRTRPLPPPRKRGRSRL